MAYQHSLDVDGRTLQVEVAQELRGYFMVRYRVVDPKYAHRDDWREVEHLSGDEALDVLLAVSLGYAEDVELSMQF